MTNASVVIVNYNSGRFLEACVDSVCRSDRSLEIIVVDNASTDGSTDFLDNLRSGGMSLQVIRNERNCGFSAAINCGVGCSKLENILLLNPDCLVFPHTIRLLCEAMDEDASAGIVGGLVFNLNGSEQRGCRRREPTLIRSLGKAFQHHPFAVELNQVDMTDEPLPEQRICVDAVSGSFLMIRRTTFADVGGMDEDFFLHFEDLDLCRRVRDVGWKVVFDPKISIFHYRGGSSEYSGHRVSWEKHRSMRRYQSKHHGRNRLLNGLVFFLVWGHFLLQITRWMFTRGSKTLEERQWAPAKWTGLSRMTVSAGGEKANRLLVLGDIDEPVRDMVYFGANIGWSIYACNEVEDAQRIADVHRLHPEYFDKVPTRDALEFNGLLIAPSLSCRGVVGRIVEKFQIRRIAIIQLAASPDRTNGNDVAELFDAKVIQEKLVGDLMKDRMWDGETRLFPLPSSNPAREGHEVGTQWDETIHDCFAWLSK